MLSSNVKLETGFLINNSFACLALKINNTLFFVLVEQVNNLNQSNYKFFNVVFSKKSFINCTVNLKIITI